VLERPRTFGYHYWPEAMNLKLFSSKVVYLHVITLIGIFVLSCGYAYSQGTKPSNTPLPDATKGRDNDDDISNEYGSPLNEMRMKMRLKDERKKYDENVARAREVSELAAQLRQIYDARKTFDTEDGKRLERLEKLTKRIRNEAGGSDTDTDLDPKESSSALEEVIDKVADLAGDLKKLVENTPRQVVNAAVINQANKIIGLVQRVRGDKKR